MHEFSLVSPDSFDFSPFRLIGKDWMLITAEKDEIVNTMTASWGGMGVIWNRNVAYIVVRKSRFTKEFIDGSEAFSLSFFDHKVNNKMLAYLGTVSGRDEDKIKNAALTVAHYDGVPYFDEANSVIVCKKLCCQPIEPQSFLMKEIDEQYYSDKDYHDLYIGEITAILSR